jgi:1,4-dihydroxy-2-naphthoyl-CoA hydrolase
MIWFKEISVDEINKINLHTAVSYLGIKMTEIGADFLKGTIPVNETTIQPFGILHGGMNCVLAETLGSLAANLCLDNTQEHAVGLTISTTHVKAVRNGLVTGVARPEHLGKTTHLWTIETFNDAQALTSKTLLTMAVIKKLK